MAQTQRYEWADFMRGLMMFLVVLYHSEVHYGAGHTWSWLFVPVFLTGFFFISGYLFTKDLNHVSLSNKVKQVLRAIIFPYFCFMIVLSIPKIIVNPNSCSQLLIDILMMRASWFVITIGMMQIVYAALLQISSSIKWVGFSTLVLFFLGYVYSLYFRTEPSWLIFNKWLNSPEISGKLPFCLNIALIQTPFFFAGILYRIQERQQSNLSAKNGIFFGVSLFLYIILWCTIDRLWIGSYMNISTNYYNNIFLMFFYAAIGIIALLCISKLLQYWKPLNYIGKYSILFYFLNGAALTAVAAIAKRIPFMSPNNYLNIIIVALIATALMFPCVWFINRYLPFLAGNKDSFNKITQRLGLNIKW